MRLIWAPLALDRLAEIADEIATDRPQAAQDLVDTILTAAQRLSDFPLSGRVVPEIRREDVREIIEGSYRIIYRVHPQQVAVLTVRHTRQLTGIDDPPG